MTAIVQIRKTLDLFRPRKASLKLGLSPENAAHELTEICFKATKFQETAHQLATDNKTDRTSSAIVDVIEEGKYEILRTAINDDLSEKYKFQLRSYKKYDQLQSFLESIFQTTFSQEEKLDMARKKMTDATRFSSENEPYINFLARLETLATSIKEQSSEEVATLYTRDAFKRNLSPQIKSFLNDHGQLNEALKVQAKFLDDKKKHISSSSVNALTRVDLAEQNERINKLTEQSREIAEQITNLTQLVQNSVLDQQTRNMEVNKVQKTQFRPNRRSQPQRLFPDRRRITCSKCGIFGHSSEECRGGLKLKCHSCGKQGHLRTVCPLSKNAQ